MKYLNIALAALTLTSCSALPNTGPSRGEIYSSSRHAEGSSHIVQVTKSLASALRVPTGYGFPSSFLGGSTANYETISPGDKILITIWENVDNGVFATLGQRVTQLQEMQVSSSGNIFVPYVGNIKASGRTPEQLRSNITASLASQTPEPQVEVRRVAGKNGGVQIFKTGVGTVAGGGGLIPFDEGNQHLASMLAMAGGVPGDPASTRITVSRGSTSGTILAQDLFDNPSYDIILKDNDRITIEADRRYFRVLGSGGAQSMLPFDRADLSVLDAIAKTGGLSSIAADPSGIFVLRTVSAQEANMLLPDGFYDTPQQFVFTIDLRQPDGLFIAEKFQLRNQDTIYVTEAPFVTWTKVIGALSTSAASVEALANTANIVNP